MTLETILKNVFSPSTSQFSNYSGPNKLFYERNGGEYYHFGSYQKPKKSKSDKKNSILSALSLLSFLFFLNILQNCIREQTQGTGTVMMFSHHGKVPAAVQEYKETENRFRRNVESSELEKSKSKFFIRDVSSRKSRKLLQVFNEKPKRQGKFIKNFKNTSNWTNELSPVSEKELEAQKLKTLNFSRHWRNNKGLSSSIHSPTVLTNKNKTDEVKNHTKVEKIPLILFNRIKKTERLTAESLTISSEKPEIPTPVPSKFIKNYKSSLEKIKNEHQFARDKSFKRSYNTTQDETQKNKTKATEVEILKENTPTTEPYVVTTSRIRRSEFVETVRPVQYNDFGQNGDLSILTTRPPVLGLDLNTYQTYPVQNYNNHRFHPIPSLENQTYLLESPHSSIKTDIRTSYNDLIRGTSESPVYYSKPVSSYPKQTYYKKVKYRSKRPNYVFIQNGNDYQKRYRNSPYRKSGIRGPYNHRDNYDTVYPIVVTQYDEEPGFDVIKLLWTLLTSFAKPLAKLVPNFGKDSSDESQCYDLIMCEAQRALTFMGSSAETFATTIGAVMTWAVTEETRPLIVQAIQSGKKNTCQQQINDCETRSGGKSTMTIIAKALEVKKLD